MINLPLSAVVSYLTRKGVSLDVLEGAPLLGTDDTLEALFGFANAARWSSTWLASQLLYLGSGPVCPAAMGWATAVLGYGHCVLSPNNIGDPSTPVYWRRGSGETVSAAHSDDITLLFGRYVAHRWVWGNPRAEQDRNRVPQTTMMSGIYLPTPAERLRAVLEYEMGRA